MVLLHYQAKTLPLRRSCPRIPANSAPPRRTTNSPPDPALKRLFLALYAAFLFGIAVWRPWTEPAAPFSGRWELAPFTGTADLWRAGFVPFVFLFVGNIVCFVPFGFGLPALTRLRRAVVPLCFLGSLLIEVLQWTFGTGVSQIEDVLLNTLGAVIGYALFRVVQTPGAGSDAACATAPARGPSFRRPSV